MGRKKNKNISKVSFLWDKEGTRQETALLLSPLVPVPDVEIQELLKIDGFIRAVGVWILLKSIQWSRAAMQSID